MILILFVLFACMNLSASDYSHTIEIINSIPKNDREEIKSLFKDLFKTHTFAYSLYGDKPMTYCDVSLEESHLLKVLEDFPLDQSCKEILEVYSEPNRLIKERWKIWKKYSDRFEIKKFLLIEKTIGKKRRIFLINKEAFKKIISQEINIFKKFIDHEISAEKLLNQFQLENTNVFSILHDNEGLLGILLGFGKHNAILFQKREHLIDLLERAKKSGIYKLDIIKKNLNKINDKLKLFHEHDFNIIASINRVMFLSDCDHSETIQLKEKYDELNKKLNEIYYKDDWFEQTLFKLTSDLNE